MAIFFDMPTEGSPIECDYLVVGAGPEGMAFVDVLLSEDSTRTVAIVDRRPRPGGEWHDACPFARLHQPSAYYGVTSRPLQSKKDGHAFKASHAVPEEERWERASKDDLVSYYSTVMKDFFQTGRVQYFPKCYYNDEGSQIVAVLNQDCKWPVTVKCKVVDTLYTTSHMPGPLARKKPRFEVARGVRIVTPSELTKLSEAPAKYVVIGAGRTGMETLLWLLSMGVEPNMVQWIVPRDMWFFSREAMSPERFGDTFEQLQRLTSDAPSVEAFMMELQKLGLLCRVHEDGGGLLSPGVQSGKRMADSTAFHGIQVSRGEAAALREVTDVIRLGHVRAIREHAIVLDEGTVEVEPDTLLINCASSSVRNAPEPVPIFQEEKIVVQSIGQAFNGNGDFNQCFCAAFTAYLEAHYPDKNSWKNQLCTPVKLVDNHLAWLKCRLLALETTRALWKEDEDMAKWTVSARPGTFASMQNSDRLKSSSYHEQAQWWDRCVDTLGRNIEYSSTVG